MMSDNEDSEVSNNWGGYSLEWPDSCVVRVELDHDVPVGADLLDVTALRVVWVHDDVVPGACALS